MADERAATIRANKSLHENASFAIGNDSEVSKVNYLVMTSRDWLVTSRDRLVTSRGLLVTSRDRLVTSRDWLVTSRD